MSDEIKRMLGAIQTALDDGVSMTGIEVMSSRKTASRPIPEAQAVELRRRWKAAQEAADLKPGDLVREKQGLGYIGRERDGGPAVLILWRMLNEGIFQDDTLIESFLQEVGAFAPLDCIVGFLPDGDSPVKLMLHNSHYLERVEGTDDAV